MKKFIALLMVALMICGSISSAMAQTTFEVKNLDSSDFYSWTTPYPSSGQNWHITWTKSNISLTHRAVVRVFSGSDYASSKFVYTYHSTNYHPYKDGYGGGNNKSTYLKGRLDDRDSGTLSAEGTFWN